MVKSIRITDSSFSTVICTAAWLTRGLILVNLALLNRATTFQLVTNHDLLASRLSRLIKAFIFKSLAHPYDPP